jgi:hypothetical protein
LYRRKAIAKFFGPVILGRGWRRPACRSGSLSGVSSWKRSARVTAGLPTPRRIITAIPNACAVAFATPAPMLCPTMSFWSCDHTPVYPREVVKRALELSASAIILVHNHPSGDPTPSQAD